jgi:hypothetical protein
MPTPPRHAEVIARSQDRNCQLLIERNDASRTTNDEANLSEKELVDKANLAVTLMGDLATDRPNAESTPFLGAQRRQRGAVLYLTRTPEDAKWLRTPQVKAAFLQHLGGAATLRDRGYAIIIEFVPVQYDPTSKEAQETVEDDNSLARNEILMTRFLKDASRRTPGQLTAFVQMTLKSPEAANQIIREGIIIEGKRVFARKNIPEARRCMKCQGYQAGHFAADCKQLNDTCTQCAGAHRTQECNKTNDPPFCSNCRSPGHRASDRSCPTLRRENARLATRNPENAYRYFPLINDPSTWELIDANSTHTRDSPDPGPRPNINQSTHDTTPNPRNDTTAHAGWTGGARGRGTRDHSNHPGTGRGTAVGRGRGFVPQPRDDGWGGFTTARERMRAINEGRASIPPSQTGTPSNSNLTDQTGGTTRVRPQARPGTQSRLDSYLTPRPLQPPAPSLLQ